MHRWNIFLIEALSMLASPQIKTVKPPDKKPGISHRSSFLRRRSVKFQFVGRAASKACWLTWFICKIPKILVCLALYYESVRFIETTTYQCQQLKLNLSSTQINFEFYCLMTNQTPALLVQRAPWAWAAVMLLQSLYFSSPPSPPPPSYNPRRPSPRYIRKSRWPPLMVRRTIFRRSQGKIRDCEQSSRATTHKIDFIFPRWGYEFACTSKS